MTTDRDQLREALVKARDYLLEVGNDYPGSSCQKWCTEKAKEVWNSVEPWRHCPSTHCERTQECRSINECSANRLGGPHASTRKLAEIIRTRLLGVHPDEQDVVLEDDDWLTILASLDTEAVKAETDANRLERLSQEVDSILFHASGNMGNVNTNREIRRRVAAAIRARKEQQP